MLINEVKGKNDNRIGSIRRIDKFEKKNNINGKIEGVRKILGIKTDFFKSVFIFFTNRVPPILIFCCIDSIK